MSRITNLKGFPDALARAMSNDSYDRGDSDFTVTELLKPARQAALEVVHRDSIEEDVEDGLYRLYGQLAHLLIERANVNDISERRFYANIGGRRISAQVDNLSLAQGKLSDYKFTTSWGFKNDRGPKPEWTAQLNMQLEILRQNGLDAQSLEIVGLLRDWRLRESKSDPAYPQAPVVSLPIPMWSRERTVAFIEMRMSEHERARVELPDCTPDERWAKPDTWAVVKRGKKRAINGGVQLSEVGAQAVCANNPGTQVVYRPGESTRCLDYCRVAKFCSFYQRLTADAPSDEEGEKNAV